MNDKMLILVVNFLKVNYPIKKIKSGHRFKKALISPNGQIFFLKQKRNKKY